MHEVAFQSRREPKSLPKMGASFRELISSFGLKQEVHAAELQDPEASWSQRDIRCYLGRHSV